MLLIKIIYSYLYEQTQFILLKKKEKEKNRLHKLKCY